MSAADVPSSRLGRKFALLITVLGLTPAGCHSAFIQATVLNRSGQPIHLFEVDYPSASFGAGELAAGGQFHYRFKVFDTGSTKLTWTDAGEHEHTAQGPDLHPGQEGALTITIGPQGATWEQNLHNER